MACPAQRVSRVEAALAKQERVVGRRRSLTPLSQGRHLFFGLGFYDGLSLSAPLEPWSPCELQSNEKDGQRVSRVCVWVGGVNEALIQRECNDAWVACWRGFL